MTTDLTAYDLYLRALSPMYSWSREGVFAALELLEQAITRDPNYAPALACAAVCRVHVHINAWTEDADRNRHAGIDYARRALAFAGDDPGTLAEAATALAYFGEDVGTMIGVLDRALALNPSFARGWHLSGALRLWAGDPDGAIERVQKSLRRSPRARVGNQLSILGMAYLVKRQFEEAAAMLRMAIQELPTFPTPYRALAACYAHMGRLAEAREIVERLRAITPVVMGSLDRYRVSEYRELVLSGLRLAMAEEA